MNDTVFETGEAVFVKREYSIRLFGSYQDERGDIRTFDNDEKICRLIHMIEGRMLTLQHPGAIF